MCTKMVPRYYCLSAVTEHVGWGCSSGMGAGDKDREKIWLNFQLICLCCLIAGHTTSTSRCSKIPNTKSTWSRQKEKKPSEVRRLLGFCQRRVFPLGPCLSSCGGSRHTHSWRWAAGVRTEHPPRRQSPRCRARAVPASTSCPALLGGSRRRYPADIS